jgi:hypothetical protein
LIERGLRFKEKKKLAGILYLHEISQERIRRSFVKNYHMFIKLCGDDAMRNVIIVTTKWTEVTPEEGERREQQLRVEFWKDVLQKGAVVARFMHTHESAWEIVDQLVPKKRLRALLIQEELVKSEMSLPETQAGKTLLKYLQDALKRYETAKDQLKAAALQKGSDGPHEEDEKRLRETETKLHSILVQIEQLKIPISKRIRAFFRFR